ncbi:UDP-N-acetylmuramate dehydrogenase [Gammaproteobacteria bacterium]|nr:UDP-N-acetylmuramate dehydrogenase [Gammaproteobacteria bacterium]
MKAPKFNNQLIDQLPSLRGRIETNVDLSKSTWFRVGGPAEVMFWPADLDDLIMFLQNKPDTVPVTVIGIGSNLMIRDGGVPGVVIRLSKIFSEISVTGMEVIAGGGLSNSRLANIACKHKISGFEFLSGIPGTVGGSIRMNAGAYGSEIKDILQSVKALDKKGNLIDLSVSQLNYSYRHSDVNKELIFIGGCFSGSPGAVVKITNRMRSIREERELTQPVKTPTGGSTFINPPGHKAWELIDAAGCRGLIRGGAVVSEKHCNFLVNIGSASAADLEGLGEEVRCRVFEDCGIKLNWEIQRLGVGIQNNLREVKI